MKTEKRNLKERNDMNFGELFGSAEWVTCESGCASPVIKGSFFIEKPRRAEITVCGLGFSACG